MRQLRQASAQGYNILGRSHDNLHGTFSPSYQPTGYRRDTLRRYASAQTLPHSGGYSAGGYSAPSPNTPVYRISGDFGSMWDRQHTSSASALHKPVFGRGISLRIIAKRLACHLLAYQNGPFLCYSIPLKASLTSLPNHGGAYWLYTHKDTIISTPLRSEVQQWVILCSKQVFDRLLCCSYLETPIFHLF